MSFPRYPAYKDSGIPWVEVIPSSWNVLPLYAVANECDEPNHGMQENNLLSLSYGRIVQKDINSNDGLLPESFETYQIVQPNDIVLRLTDLQNDQRSLRSALVEQTGIITSAYLAVRPQEVAPRFLSYLLRAYDTTKVFYSMGGGLRQSMKFADLKRLPVVLPPMEEQPLIATFLDHETAKIDALVAEQERLIELLKEKRQAVISHAVTKGLDPSVPMKDSGVEWLGEVPAHWEVKQIKHVISLLTDYTSNGSFASLAENVNYLSEGYSRLVRLTDLREDLNNEGIFVDQAAHHFLAKSELFGGEVLIANVGAYAGYACLMPSGQGKATLGPNMYLINFKKSITSNEFGHLCLMSPSVQEQLKLAATSTAQPKLNKEDVKSCVTAIPPTIDEQTKILAFVAVRRSEFDSLIAETKRGIALLQERRTALISAAVTGQIDVRNMVPALPA